MSIEIKAVEPRDETRQVAFFTLDGQEFSCGNVPIALTKTEEIQAYLDSRVNEFNLLLLKREYPESDHKRFQKQNMTELVAMSEWILKGLRNKVVVGETTTGKPKYEYVTIGKKPLTYKPAKSVKLKPIIEAATRVDKLKEVILKVL